MILKKLSVIFSAAVVAISAMMLTAGAADSVKINEKNFPDEIFRAYVQKNFDKDEDGMLSEKEISNVKRIIVRNNVIESVKGVEYFTELEYLNCEHNNIGEFDLTKNTKLRTFCCGKNIIPELDLSKNTELEWLDCYGCGLTELDVSKNKELTYLACYHNDLKKLDVSKNTKLRTLYCENNEFTSLDLSKNTELADLDCGNNHLKKLDISKNKKLIDLLCDNNELTSLNVSKNIKLDHLRFSNNQIKSIDLSKNKKLTRLYCDGNKLVSLSVVSDGFSTFKCGDNKFVISASKGESYDLSKLEKYGFDPEKASNWSGAEYDKKTNTIKIKKRTVTYTYDAGGYKVTFTLIAKEK